MGMTISEAISKLRYELNKNNKMANAYTVAIDTMHKYQKIQEIIDDYEGEGWERIAVSDIREVLKDGDDD